MSQPPLLIRGGTCLPATLLLFGSSCRFRDAVQILCRDRRHTQLLTEFFAAFEDLFRCGKGLLIHLGIVKLDLEFPAIFLEHPIAFLDAGSNPMRMSFFIAPSFHRSYGFDYE